MQARHLVNDALARVGEIMGNLVSLDENGVCALGFENDLECVIEVPEDSSLVYVHSFVMRTPVMDREAFLQKVLSCNLYGLKTGGGFLALNPESDEILLCYTCPAESIDPDQFPAFIEHFMDTLEKLRSELQYDEREKEETDENLEPDPLQNLRNEVIIRG